MAKTQSEKIDEINTKIELLNNQQRVVIGQNDKILEFVDAIYQALAAGFQEAAAEAPPESLGVSEDKVNEILDIFKNKDEDKEPYWGYNRDQARKAAQNGD